MEYISSDVFNKIEFLKFNSTVGEFVGYTEFGVHNAWRFNNNSALLTNMQAMRDAFCKPNAVVFIRNIRNRTGEYDSEKKSRHSSRLSSSAHEPYLSDKVKDESFCYLTLKSLDLLQF